MSSSPVKCKTGKKMVQDDFVFSSIDFVRGKPSTTCSTNIISSPCSTDIILSVKSFFSYNTWLRDNLTLFILSQFCRSTREQSGTLLFCLADNISQSLSQKSHYFACSILIKTTKNFQIRYKYVCVCIHLQLNWCLVLWNTL